MINKIVRKLRRIYFAINRFTKSTNPIIKNIVKKTFITIFPKAKKALEKKDKLIGLEHGPSSYFLKTISEKEILKETVSKTRRKIKNV